MLAATPAGSADAVLSAITYAGFALALVGLGFSAWQTRQTLEQAKGFAEIERKAEASLERLERVAAALPTRILGDWPGYLTDLARFVERTEHYLKIVRDVPAYGALSNLPGHQEYQRALEDCLLGGNDLDIVFMSPPSRRQLNIDFSSADARGWSPQYSQRISDWTAELQLVDPSVATPTNFDQFLDLLESLNEKIIRRIENAARTGSDRVGRKLLIHRETDAMIPLYIWIRDGVEAIFAVAVFAPEDEKEIAFITTDLGLVKALEAAFDRYSAANGSCSADQAPAWP